VILETRSSAPFPGASGRAALEKKDPGLVLEKVMESPGRFLRTECTGETAGCEADDSLSR